MPRPAARELPPTEPARRRVPAPLLRLVHRVRDGADRTRAVGARVIAGDRPLVVGLLALLAICLVMVSGPLQSYWEGRSRVELLEAKGQALGTEIERLEQRAEDLRDPRNIELLAREEHGMIRPGEVPYAIVPPEAERPRITAPRELPAEERSWYRRAWEAVANLFS